MEILELILIFFFRGLEKCYTTDKYYYIMFEEGKLIMRYSNLTTVIHPVILRDNTMKDTLIYTPMNKNRSTPYVD